MRFDLFLAGLVSGLVAALGAIWMGAGPGMAGSAYALAAGMVVLGLARRRANLARARAMPVTARRGLPPPPLPSRRR